MKFENSNLQVHQTRTLGRADDYNDYNDDDCNGHDDDDDDDDYNGYNDDDYNGHDDDDDDDCNDYNDDDGCYMKITIKIIYLWHILAIGKEHTFLICMSAG